MEVITRASGGEAIVFLLAVAMAAAAFAAAAGLFARPEEPGGDAATLVAPPV